jgi:hypothetical protein
MGADFSRVFDHTLLDYAGVELKQGGVLLDSDVNELVAILDRRLRALAGDVLGRATVGANTPEAFRITVSSGKLLIGRGRMYVDGLLAENHGAADFAEREFDALMAESRFTAPVPYDAQPYLPGAPPLPASGRHLVHLDVWKREVTHLENPELVESAVGVETSSRLQTVWQVRVLAEGVGAGTTCGSPDAGVPGWLDVIAPSTGRLTTGTYDVSGAADPCELPPTGGYRGLENQLYRVEIHDPGQPGAGATFKWSDNNVSVGSRVVSIESDSALQLETLGRDDLLRFKTGDWVEIIDDVREFSQACGEMRKVTVDEAARRLTFTPPLPPAMLPASFPDSERPKTANLRVRLWKHGGIVRSATGGGATAVHQDLDAPGSTGVIDVPAPGTTLLLENGVTVSFGSAGAKGFRAGDYWVFAARTSDASVEALQDAPPRGIHHHYARLALWEVDGNAEPTDCRNPWPPRGGDDCGCTQCVTPESHASGQLTIQDAVRRLQDTGGTVCLKTGQYALAEPVRIVNARSVTIKGQGPATVIGTAGEAFHIEGSTGITIENLTVISLGKQAVIDVRTVAAVTLQRLQILVANVVDGRAAAIALSGSVLTPIIRDNFIVAPEGVRALNPNERESPQFLIAAGLRIEHNLLACPRRALNFTGLVGHLLASRICDNEVTGSREAGISLLGFVLPGASVHVNHNSLNVNGPGIQCATDGTWIEGNKVRGVTLEDRPPIGSGISLAAGLDPTGLDQCQVLANQIEGFPDAGILISAPVADLIVKLNIISRCGNGIVMLGGGSSGVVSIENNHLRDIGHSGAPTLGPFVLGISVMRAAAARAAGNALHRIGVSAPRGTGIVAGVAAFGVRRTTVSGNDIAEVGPASELPGTQQAGILLHAPYVENDVSSNHVTRDVAPAPPDVSTWSAVLADEPDPQRPIIRTGAFAAVRLTATRTLFVHADHAFLDDVVAALPDDVGAAATRQTFTGVRGNVVAARGNAPAVSVTSSAIQFGDNRCEFNGRGVAAVSLIASGAIVNSNIVRGGSSAVAVAAGHVTVLGNATNRPITINGQALAGTPWGPFNVSL